ncbi:MAG: TonB-dependent receptor [Sphingobium sp.]
MKFVRKAGLAATRLLLLATVAPTVAHARAQAPDDALAAEADARPDDIIVLGSRSASRTVAESTAPIDVVSNDNLAATGGAASQLRDALASLVPSFKVDTASNGAYNTFGRPAGLRGLSGAHVLVLVNGKRRHPTSIPLPAAGQAPGANAADLDQIPLGAIERVEILRDGAAAQYGSDAVAGVINIVLKKSVGTGAFTLYGGQRYEGDGDQGQARIDYGFRLPNDGSLHLAVDLLDQDYTFRPGLSTQQIYPLVNGQPDPREATRDRRLVRGGLAKVKALYSSYNAELPVGGLTLYSYGTFGIRDIKNGQTYRLPNSTSFIPELYSDVVQPTGRFPDKDFQILLGGRGALGSWSWDVSSTFGRHHADNGMEDTLNPSMGPQSPTRFDTFDAIFDQWTSNADIRRGFDIGWAEDLNIALGAEFRRERYRTIIQDAAAYLNGQYIYPAGSPFAGQPAAIGAQGGITILPGDAADIARNNISAYLDLSTRPLPGWDIGVAGRFEHYNDSAGNVVVGKVTSRVALTRALALRATLSNGFRAPSLTQQGFASASRGFSIVNGQIAGLTTTRVVAPSSPTGIALGATPLKPERSVNLSGGLAFNPSSALAVTVDAYAIWLRDRISQTGNLSGTGVNAILLANGLESGQIISYYTNAIDTRTLGVDVVGDYSHDLGGWGKVHWSLGFNYNQTRITKIAATPARLANLGLTLFDRVAQGYIEVGNPRTKVILGSDVTVGPVNVNLRLQRYGSVQLLTVGAVNDQYYGARVIADLELGYKASDRVSVAIGANNLFDSYPARSTIVDNSGSQLYAQNSPFGFYGGFYYARATYRFGR